MVFNISLGVVMLVLAGASLYCIIKMIKDKSLTNSYKNRKEIKDMISKKPQNLKFWESELEINTGIIVNWYLLYLLYTILFFCNASCAIYLFLQLRGD